MISGRNIEKINENITHHIIFQHQKEETQRNGETGRINDFQESNYCDYLLIQHRQIVYQQFNILFGHVQAGMTHQGLHSKICLDFWYDKDTLTIINKRPDKVYYNRVGSKLNR